MYLCPGICLHLPIHFLSMSLWYEQYVLEHQQRIAQKEADQQAAEAEAQRKYEMDEHSEEEEQAEEAPQVW